MEFRFTRSRILFCSTVPFRSIRLGDSCAFARTTRKYSLSLHFVSMLSPKRQVDILLFCIVGACTYGFNTLDLNFDQIGIDDILQSSSSYLSVDTFGLIRIICGSVIWLTCLHILVDPTGLTIQVLDTSTSSGKGKKKGSSTVQKTSGRKFFKLHLVGIERFTPFTLWCWSLQGWYFGITTIVFVLSKYDPSLLQHWSMPYIARSLWVMYEISFAMAYLVTLSVTFALIPQAKKNDLPYDNFFKPLPLLMHNANVLFMAIELGLNSLQFSASHLLFCTIFGITYVLFAWYWYTIKGMFYYFFIDYHQPYALAFHVALISVMITFFSLGNTLSYAIKSYATESEYPFIALLLFTLLIMKFPERSEWYIVSDAIMDTWHGNTYVQGEPSPRRGKLPRSAGFLANQYNDDSMDNDGETPTLQAAPASKGRKAKNGSKNGNDRAVNKKQESRSRSRSSSRVRRSKRS
jgi:hypothetical protein